jgi:hypothetical protein
MTSVIFIPAIIYRTFSSHIKVKVKGKTIPVTGHEGP